MTKNYSNNEYMKLNGRQWRVNAGGNLYVDKAFMRRAFEEIDVIYQTYSQMNTILFNLHLPSGSSHPTNEVISAFIRKLKSVLMAPPYNLKRFAYMWVREQEQSDVPHYHVAIFVDESRVHHPGRLLDILKGKWKQVSNGGHFSYVKDCFHIVNRGDEGALGEVVYRVSYLGKLRSKGKRLSQTNDYSMSRLTSAQRR